MEKKFTQDLKGIKKKKNGNFTNLLLTLMLMETVVAPCSPRDRIPPNASAVEA